MQPKGDTFKKLGRNGSRRTTQLFLSFRHESVCWLSTGAHNKLFGRKPRVTFNNILKVESGQKTPNYIKHGRRLDPSTDVDNCFSLVTRNRSLDLIASCPEARKVVSFAHSACTQCHTRTYLLTHPPSHPPTLPPSHWLTRPR